MPITQMRSGLEDSDGRPPPVDRLFQSLILAAVSYTGILRLHLGAAARLRDRKGPPPEWAFPWSADDRRAMVSGMLPGKALTGIAGGTENESERKMVEDCVNRGWPELLERLIADWNTWRDWIAVCREGIPGVAPWMDLAAQPRAERWTHETEVELNALEATCSWIVVGTDGRGLWQHELPSDFSERLSRLGRRIEDLRVVHEKKPGGQPPEEAPARSADATPLIPYPNLYWKDYSIPPGGEIEISVSPLGMNAGMPPRRSRFEHYWTLVTRHVLWGERIAAFFERSDIPEPVRRQALAEIELVEFRKNVGWQEVRVGALADAASAGEGERVRDAVAAAEMALTRLVPTAVKGRQSSEYQLAHAAAKAALETCQGLVVPVSDAILSHAKTMEQCEYTGDASSSRWELQLTPGAKRLWAYLAGRCGLGKELAKPTALDTSEQTIREQVAEIRATSKNREVIGNRPGYGYFRSDKPPVWDDVKPKRQRRVGRP